MKTKIESKQINLVSFEVVGILFHCGIDKIDVNLE